MPDLGQDRADLRIGVHFGHLVERVAARRHAGDEYLIADDEAVRPGSLRRFRDMRAGDALLLHRKLSRLLQQPIRSEDGVSAAPPDDDVVVEGDAEPPGAVLNLSGPPAVAPEGL